MPNRPPIRFASFIGLQRQAVHARKVDTPLPRKAAAATPKAIVPKSRAASTVSRFAHLNTAAPTAGFEDWARRASQAEIAASWRAAFEAVQGGSQGGQQATIAASWARAFAKVHGVSRAGK